MRRAPISSRATARAHLEAAFNRLAEAPAPWSPADVEFVRSELAIDTLTIAQMWAVHGLVQLAVNRLEEER